MNRLQIIGIKVNTSISDEIINELLFSKDDDQKLFALMTIRKKVEENFIPAFSYFDTAKQFLFDSDNDCKWQSFIIVGSFMETKSDECWEIIVQSGNSNDEDTRAAVATILLEHYFEKNPYFFEKKFREYRRLIKAGSKNLSHTLSLCSSSWGNNNNRNKVDKFLETQKSGV